MLPDIASHNESPLVFERYIDNLHEFLHCSASSGLQSPPPMTIDDLLVNESFCSLPPPPSDADLDPSAIRKDSRLSKTHTFENIQRCYLNDRWLPTDAANNYDLLVETTVSKDGSLYPHILELILATASDVEHPLNHSCSSIGSDDTFCDDDSIVITKRRILKRTMPVLETQSSAPSGCDHEF